MPGIICKDLIRHDIRACAWNPGFSLTFEGRFCSEVSLPIATAGNEDKTVEDPPTEHLSKPTG